MTSVTFLSMLFVFVSGLWTNVNAKTLFADDFEGGLSDKWVIANQDGGGNGKSLMRRGTSFFRKQEKRGSSSALMVLHPSRIIKRSGRPPGFERTVKTQMKGLKLVL